MNMTKSYDIEQFKEEYVLEMIKEVYELLIERGYNPINQMVGYLMSGDPGYITNYNQARNKIVSIDRNKILEILLKESIL